MRQHFRPQAILVAVLTAALVVVATASLASAHARFENSTPAANATVATLPRALQASFSQELAAVKFTITGPDGTNVVDGSPTIDLAQRKNASVPLRNAGPGTYTVVWSNLSGEDDEANDGSFVFSVAGAAPSPAPAPTPSPAVIPPSQPSAPAAQPSTSQVCAEDGKVTPGISDVRVNTYCKRQAIREQYHDKIDENTFNFLLAEGLGLDNALREAMEALESGPPQSDHH